MRQTIELCTAPDGVRIAWASVGSGPPLVKAANWLNHLEYDWTSPLWRHAFTALARDFRLIRYDERGNGLSDWDAAELSLEAFVQDLEAVVDAAGLERFSLLGVSQGCAVSIAYAVRHPDRVSQLVLYGGFAAGWVHGSLATQARHEALITLTEQGWGRDNPAYRQLFTSLYIPDGQEEHRRWLDDLQRVTTSPTNAARLQRAIGAMNVRHLLGEVRVPTLVLHMRDDAVVPFGNGRELAAAIPGARFVPLSGRNHLPLAHDPGWSQLLAELRAFLLGGQAAPVSDAALPSLGRRLVTGGALAGGLGAELARDLGVDRDAATPAGFEPGEVVAGRYRIDERLARGGMGLILRARDTVLERDVAVKVVTGSGPHWRERVLREARAVAALNHPHIAAIHDVGEAGGAPYLVMELVAGPDLAQAPPRDLAEALRLAIQVCDALDHAHQRGIVHRDLKPANILRTGPAPAAVKLVDLGIALAAGEARLTGTGFVLGTPTYLAPEQARGGPVDGRTDLYALGAMLYEWTAGRPPFEADDLMAVVAQHLHVEPTRPAALRPDLPEPLSAVIVRLLAKSPSDRPATAAEVRAALASVG